MLHSISIDMMAGLDKSAVVEMAGKFSASLPVGDVVQVTVLEGDGEFCFQVPSGCSEDVIQESLDKFLVDRADGIAAVRPGDPKGQLPDVDGINPPKGQLSASMDAEKVAVDVAKTAVKLAETLMVEEKPDSVLAKADGAVLTDVELAVAPVAEKAEAVSLSDEPKE